MGTQTAILKHNYYFTKIFRHHCSNYHFEHQSYHFGYQNVDFAIGNTDILGTPKVPKKKAINRNRIDFFKIINRKRKDQLKTKEDVPVIEASELYKKGYNKTKNKRYKTKMTRRKMKMVLYRRKRRCL